MGVVIRELMGPYEGLFNFRELMGPYEGLLCQLKTAWAEPFSCTNASESGDAGAAKVPQ